MEEKEKSSAKRVRYTYFRLRKEKPAPNVYNDLNGKPEISWRIEDKNIKRERTDSGKFLEIYPWQLCNNQLMISTLLKKIK
jgi:hypothetical protein